MVGKYMSFHVSLTDETLILDDNNNDFVATTFQDASDYAENYEQRAGDAEMIVRWLNTGQRLAVVLSQLLTIAGFPVTDRQRAVFDEAKNLLAKTRTEFHPAMRPRPDPAQSEICIPISDARDLDDVVHALGIEDSHVTPAEAVAELKSEIERLNRLLDWCKPRLKLSGYAAQFDRYRREMPAPDFTSIVQSEASD